VLRRIIRRAIRHGYQLGQHQPFFHRLVSALAAEMGAAYPELAKGADHVVRVLKQEEERFAETLENGMALLETAIQKLKGKTIAGETVFKLYDTYGFPVDLTADIARERGLAIDQPGFEQAMEAQRDRARAASKFGVDLRGPETLDAESTFCGYEHLKDEGKIVAILKEGVEVAEAGSGESVQIVLDRTPFYAESGGQVGDVGELATGAARFRVVDTRKLGDAHLQSARSSLAASRKATSSRPPSMPRRGRRPCATTRLRICCKPDCARCWASM
jgi:alanyl-tRNA synthetase